MHDPPYDVVRYRPGMEAAITELQTHHWSSRPERNARYFHWKYVTNPFATPDPLVYVVVDGDRALGMRGFFGTRWEVGGCTDPVDALFAGDLVIAPDHRGRGLHGRIMRSALDDLERSGFRHVFNLSGSATTRVSSLIMGWQSACAVSRMEWSEAWKGAATLLGSSGDHAPGTFEAFDGPSLPRTTRRGIVVDRSPRAAAMAAVVRRIGHDGHIRHLRDEAYFSWRFENPLASYRFLYSGADDLDGYLVLSAPGERGTAWIVDWEGTTSSVRRELLRSAMQIGRFRYLEIWPPSAPSDARELLRQQGFRDPPKRRSATDYSPALLVRALGETSSGAWRWGGWDLLDESSWDLRMIYSDGA